MVKTRNSTYKEKQDGRRVTRAAAARNRCFTGDVLVDREGQELLAGRVTRKKGMQVRWLLISSRKMSWREKEKKMRWQ